MPPDVLIVGAGPAGATAALVLARAGVRVLLVDRARFPRPKLCGDTLNPGTLALLQRLGLEAAGTQGAVRLEGMRLTGPGGASVVARYPKGFTGAALPRREFDARLLEAAVQAGAACEEGAAGTRPLTDAAPVGSVSGAAVRLSHGATCELRAKVTIAADGRASTLGFALGLVNYPPSPRRWAIGAYYEGVAGVGPLGEMHVRAHHYIGLAPLPGGVTNAILVLPLAAARGAQSALPDLLAQAINSDPGLAPRFTRARPVAPPTILGPLAVNVAGVPPPGLLLAGDAAGFIDPITGDGMRFALAGGELAARAALEALTHGWPRASERLAEERRRAFGRKQRFNRAVRTVTSSPAAVRALAACTPLLRPLLVHAAAYAGDVP